MTRGDEEIMGLFFCSAMGIFAWLGLHFCNFKRVFCVFERSMWSAGMT